MKLKYISAENRHIETLPGFRRDFCVPSVSRRAFERKVCIG
jgi:hypothetical protein